jgi:hypothetical protein
MAALLAACCGLSAVAGPTASQGNNGQAAIAQSGETPAANFGTPPSGQIPILFNDHHVYSKPDVLKQGRVLAALVRGGTVLIPLRSMFEQMGASVAYNAGTKTVTVSKPGSEVRVTVGRPEVVINGESRPLDVPPMMYQGSVLVPVRVISEGMGAYVQWVPDKQVVVVRYLPPTPPPAPTEAPTVAPTIAPTPTPAPVATPYKDIFIAGDYVFSPKVYNEFAPGNTGKSSYAVRGAWEFDAANLPWMLEGTFEQYEYPHNCTTFNPPNSSLDCNVTTIGQTGQVQVPAFQARDSDFDVRLGLKVADPRIYVGVGYLFRSDNYGYPRQTGWGFGAEKLPDLNQAFSLYGSIWYYPNTKGGFTDPGTGATYTLAYNTLKYQIGGTVAFGNSPVFLDLGWIGINGKNKTNAPSDYSMNGPYLGLGIKF